MLIQPGVRHLELWAPQLFSSEQWLQIQATWDAGNMKVEATAAANHWKCSMTLQNTSNKNISIFHRLSQPQICVVNGLHLYSAFTHLWAHTHKFVNKCVHDKGLTPTLQFSDVFKDTLTCRQGIKPQTMWLMDNPLSLLSHRQPVVWR